MSFDYANSNAFSSFGNIGSFSWDTFLKSSDIPHVVQDHLSKVYLALCATMCFCAFGVHMYIEYGIGNHLLGAIASVLIIMYMNHDQNKGDTLRRTALLCGFGFFKGMTISSLVYAAMIVDPSIVMTSVLSTVVVFLCFSATALLAKRRSYLYLGGVLSSALMLISLANLGNIFFRSDMIYDLTVQAGLVAFAGLIIVDTQVIVEKACNGSRDVAGHASNLFVDIVAVFVRVLVMLLKQRDRRDSRRKRR